MAKGIKLQRKSPNAVERLLSAIAQARVARHVDEFRGLSNGEFVERVTAILSDDPADRRLIAYAFAARLAGGPDLDDACELLEGMGIGDIAPEQLTAMRDSPTFAAFKQAFAEYPDDEAEYDYEQCAERFRRIRSLAIAAGSIAAGLGWNTGL
jgi:hypothetical protein